jgi:hypothetical protein
VKFEFDKPTSDMEVFKGAEVLLKSGDVGYYDPILTLKIEDGVIKINNGFHHYHIPKCEVSKIALCNRNPIYDEEIDVIWYKDTDHVVIWENKDE